MTLVPAPRRKIVVRRPALRASPAPTPCEHVLSGSGGFCDAEAATADHRAWQEFLASPEVRVCARVNAAAESLTGHLRGGPAITRAAYVIEGEASYTAAAAAAALRHALRADRVPAQGTLWISVPEEFEARDVVPSITQHLRRPRPRGQDSCSWTRDVLWETRTSYVIFSGFEHALHGRGINILRESELPCLIKDQQETQYVFIGDSTLCATLVRGFARHTLAHYLIRLPLAVAGT